MDSLTVTGQIPLSGDVIVSGAKNSALKLMAATILAPGRSVLCNVPDILDVRTMSDVLSRMGAKIEWPEAGVLAIDTSELKPIETPYELVSKMRASIIVLGPMLARFGRARVAMPGGCNIGSRKIDMHLKGLERLGAKFEVEHGFIDGTLTDGEGCFLPLEFPSVGATENALMASVLIEGKTVIENAAREPEIVDLGRFLVAMGAKIEGLGTSTLEIDGVKTLAATEYRVIGDRVEAGTYLIAGAATQGEVTTIGVAADYLELLINKLLEAGAKVDADGERITVSMQGRPVAVDISTLPYPGFPTDLQAQFMAFLTVAEGISIVTENVFESRFMFADELNRMGSDIRIDGHHAIIRGVPSLSGAPVKAPDLRGGAALVIAAMMAEGVSEIRGCYHIDRGYESFADKMAGLGARIERKEYREG